MVEPSARGASYCAPPQWPQLGEIWETALLTDLAVHWISTNRYFIASLVGEGGDGWDAGDVISSMAYRALRGRGVTRSLREHVEGSDRITNPAGILTYHARRMMGEYVKESALRRAHEVPTSELPDNGSYTELRLDPSGESTDGYQQVIDALSDQTLSQLNGAAPPPAIVHVQASLQDIWKVFCRVAPPAVVQEVRAWPDEHRHLMLLAIFPLRLPHRAVATYRRLAWPDHGGAKSEAATQRQISRLRTKLQRLWPPELAPRTLRSADSDPDGDQKELS
jgi:hypothetical protein